MTHYWSFVVFALVIAVAPGPDTLLTLRSTVTGGRRGGLWTMAGITLAGTLQGVLAASGLGAIIARAEPVFEVIRWAGVVYLAYLGVQALWSARRAAAAEEAVVAAPVRVAPARAFGRGFLCNITNPKVLAFNLAVLPQFLSAGAGASTLLAYALTLAGLGGLVLLLVVLGADAAKRTIGSRRARRRIDAAAGVTFVGFAAVLAAEA
ncbi:LysE family translocator [Cellulomonas edaphi]|uniref:LysE family translocator n=1 Tax=Cellulomonas edaphi TaxID=3053468 RepID=A0ABT7S8I2_9CELL|nr:LysE family translocator [Cellulomons edaphi]MDM7831923.1 LysE family translocator [Cellulomons edaphi]